ncbi:MAG: SDR family NAD(P)-dependent oxidoreductase [Pseudomonadales bacterium]
MTVLHETMHISRPVHEVFAYIADFSTCTEWDSTAISSVKGAGPLGLGSTFDVVCALPLGSLNLHYEIIEWLPNEKVVLRGTCRFFDIEDTILFRGGDSTTVEYTAHISYKGWLSRFASQLEPGLKRMGYASVCVGMKTALEDDNPAPALSAKNARADRWLATALARFSRRGYRQGREDWLPVSAYMGDKHVLITGATSGLGLATAQALAAKGARLTLVARDKNKGESLVQQLIADTGNQHITLELANLELMTDIRQLVGRLLDKDETIDVLVNNAGALFNTRQLTAEGLEKNFALLLLGPCILTEGLYPLLKKSSQGRVINVLSGGLYTQKLCVDNLQGEIGDYSGSTAYALNKRALLVKTEQWAEQWQKEGIVVNAMHPGWADTPGVQSALPLFRSITRPILRTPAEGADTIIWLSIAKEAAKVTGQFFLDREPRTTHLLQKTREDEVARVELEKIIEEYV